MSLVVDNVSCSRGGRVVFSNAALRAPAGAFVALKGPNGSGKSTFLRAVAGLIASHGEVRWGETRLSDDRDAFQEHVAYAGHLDAVKPSLTVRENLTFWGELFSSAAPAVVHETLERFRLDHLSEAPAAYCSAGQKRRLGLARLGLMKRPLWLLDEPTVSLDRESVAEFAALVASHCAGGGVAIAATHIDLGLPGVIELRMDAFAPSETRRWRGRSGLSSRIDDPFLDPALSETPVEEDQPAAADEVDAKIDTPEKTGT